VQTLVFDIETIPDIQLLRDIHEWDQLDDAEVHQAAVAHNRYTRGSDFFQLHLHQIVAISVVLRAQDQISVWSLGDENASEKELIQRFFTGIEKFQPTLVSWNGSGFDLPVLHYRAMKHSVNAQHYWDTGRFDQQLKYNNYVNRYHARHTDVMDVLALYNGRATAKLDQIAVMLGYPGKMGMSGDKVYTTWRAGNIAAIRNYCETDVLNTYLVYLRFQEMQGVLSHQDRQQEEILLQQLLQNERTARPHLGEFVDLMNHASTHDTNDNDTS